MAKRKKKRFRKIKFVLEVLVLIVLASGLFVAAKFVKIKKENLSGAQITKNEAIPESTLKRMEGYTDIALFGVDSRSGQLESGTNSDTIMVCSINNETGEIKLVSVYRDTYLDTTGGEYRKCTETYAIGGAGQSVAMLNKNLDLNISEYITVNFEALVDAVDLVGGVDITLTEGEVQWLNGYLVEEREVLQKECEDVAGPGLQHLNGMQALAYCRIRYIGLDYERTERQRTVLEQILTKARISDPITLNGMLDAILPKISTSLSAVDLLKLVMNGTSYTIGETEGFPFEKTTAMIDAGDCVIPVNLSANVSKLHEFLYGTADYVPSETVQAISDAIAAETGIYGQ